MSQDAPSLAALDADIARLEDALERAVRALSGDDAVACSGALRDDARALRDGSLPGGRYAFAARVAGLSVGALQDVARVVTQWFHLTNAAEEQHRLRVLRHRDDGERVPGDSLAAGFRQLVEAGFTADEVRALLASMFVMPVLTAHPTEARRRSVLDHLGVIARALDELDRRVLSAAERRRVQALLDRTVFALYATEESRATKPAPQDEVRTGLHVFRTTLMDVTPAVYRALETAATAAYPGEEFQIQPFFRWGSWIGGDRDGNPFVTARVTRWVFEQQRQCVLERYLADVDELLREISVSARRAVGDVDALDASLQSDRERLPEIAARARPYTINEPWREKLWYVRARLEQTRARGEDAYAGVEEYLDDLRQIADSLVAVGFAELAGGALADAIRRAEVFGFHLASLDLRQHAAVHERAVGEILGWMRASAGGDDAALYPERYRDLDEPARVAVLTALLERPDVPFPQVSEIRTLSAEARELIETLDMVGRARRDQGAAACERYIVSFTQAPSDLLEVLFLIRAARLSPGELRPVPLLEQLEDLDHAAQIAEAMLDIRPLRAALGGELEVMIGYSDAGKQIGYFASAVALRRAQLALAEVAARRGVTLTIFHGRGGAIGRGGGPANRAIRAQPPRALGGRLRVTEQGETVTARYARPAIAQRDLEQMVHAVLVSAIEARRELAADELAARNRLLDEAAAAAQGAYARLLEDPDRLARYAVAATPIEQVAALPIGSRPASRRPGLALDDLRAIPWVFSWNQSRHGLPGWFGIGSALDVIIGARGLDATRELYAVSPFFRAMVNNAQLALARADIDVARCYATLADDDARQIFALIAAEHERTVTRVLQVASNQTLLGNRPHLAGAIERRNPQVDVLSHVQIELLGRLRAAGGEDERKRLLTALFITINGIAAGLQTAG